MSLQHIIFFIGRTRDIKDVNRRCAFNTLAEKVSIRALTIAQRIKVLTVGLNDRSAIVKQACMKMLKAWLRSYEYNIIKLLEALDTEGSCECSKLMLEAMLKGYFVSEFIQYNIKAHYGILNLEISMKQTLFDLKYFNFLG